MVLILIILEVLYEAPEKVLLLQVEDVLILIILEVLYELGDADAAVKTLLRS